MYAETMPNKPATQHRSVRISNELWAKADDVARSASTDRAAVINAFLRWYVKEPGAKLPTRPD